MKNKKTLAMIKDTIVTIFLGMFIFVAGMFFQTKEFIKQYRFITFDEMSNSVLMGLGLEDVINEPVNIITNNFVQWCNVAIIITIIGLLTMAVLTVYENELKNNDTSVSNEV